MRKPKDTRGHTVACFVRVDVGLPGGPSSEAYDPISNRLQDLLQEAILQRADGGQPIDLQAMTCLVLGPLDEADTINAAIEYEDNFAGRRVAVPPGCRGRRRGVTCSPVAGDGRCRSQRSSARA